MVMLPPLSVCPREHDPCTWSKCNSQCRKAGTAQTVGFARGHGISGALPAQLRHLSVLSKQIQVQLFTQLHHHTPMVPS